MKIAIAALVIGQRVNLECDPIADPDYFAAAYDTDVKEAALLSEHPEWQFEYEVVYDMQRESSECIRVDFNSGFSCGFPPDHMVDVDAEQDLTEL